MTGPRRSAKLRTRRGRGFMPVACATRTFSSSQPRGATMDRALFQRLAEQCRELMPRARNNLVREQLLLWAEEFAEDAAPTRLGEPDAGNGGG